MDSKSILLITHEINLPDDKMVTSAVCFHSQQLVEKSLKAFLVEKSVDFPRTHNLEFLKELFTQFHHGIPMKSISFPHQSSPVNVPKKP